MPRKRRSVSSEDSDDEFDEARHPQRNAANARERARMRVLSKAFCRLKTTLPWVPADTKLSKLDTLRLATSYIAHLRAVLMDQPPPDDNTHKHPLTLTWPFSFQRPDSSPDGAYHEPLNAHHNSWIDVPPSQQPVIRDKDKYAEHKETEKDIWKQVTTLQEQLEYLRETNFKICQELRCVYNSEPFNITTKYVALQEKHQELCHKKIMLEDELKKLQFESSTDLKELSLQCDNNVKQHEENGKINIRAIQGQIDKEIAAHNEEVQQLYNQLDVEQAATALQEDEVETELCKELVDINVKIRQMQKINTDMRSEIIDRQRALKHYQNSCTMFHNTEKSSFQIDQTETTTNNRPLHNNYSEPLNNFPENTCEETNIVKLQSASALKNMPNNYYDKSTSQHFVPNKNITITKYQPLPVLGIKLNYEKTNKNTNLNSSKSNNGLPKDVKTNDNTKFVKNNNLEGIIQQATKKRRLFDPDNLDYLDSIKISEN